jgi:hypothetical protein
VASRVYLFATLVARPASNEVSESLEASIVPATGLHSESSRFPKGTFKARTSKAGSFLNFLSSVLVWLKRPAPKVAFVSKRKAILLRAVSELL